MWVITRNPSDFPGKFVARLHVVASGSSTATNRHHVGDTLDEARSIVPGWMVRLELSPDEDPVIVEAWA